METCITHICKHSKWDLIFEIMKIDFKKNYRRRKKYVLLYSQGYKVHLGQKCSNDVIHRISVCLCVCFILNKYTIVPSPAIIHKLTCGICCRNSKRSKCWLSSFKSLKLKAFEEGSTGRKPASQKQYKNVIEKYLLLDSVMEMKLKYTLLNHM